MKTKKKVKTPWGKTAIICQVCGDTVSKDYKDWSTSQFPVCEHCFYIERAK